MKKKVLFIVNPKSGKGAIRNQLLEVVDTFIKADFDMTIYISQAAGDARKKTEGVAGRFDLIVCSGGDGTLDEVISGVMTTGDKCAIGYIPCGSTNDFARSLKLPTTIPTAAQHITQWNEFPCDIGLFNDDYFVYIAAFGLFTDVSYGTDQDMKNALGHLAYILEGMKKLTTIKSYALKIQAEDMTVEGNFIFGMVTNSTSVGGFSNLTGKNVLLDDGVFEVTLIRTPKDIAELNEMIQETIAGRTVDRFLYQFTTREISFEAEEEVPWTLDGEFGGYHKTAVVKNDNKALTLLI